MKARDFENHVKQGDIDRVTVFRPARDSAWSIFGYGEGLPSAMINVIELNERGDKRLWADLEAAYAFIRKSGYTQVIEIDG